MTNFLSLHKLHSGKQLALRNYNGQQSWPFCCLFIWVHRFYMKKQQSYVLLGIVLAASATGLNAATIYDPGVSPPDATSGLTFGTHLISGPHTSVAGVGGSGLSANGSVHNGQRTYIYGKGAGPDLADGIANRGDAGFAMMIWDMGLAYDSLRLYTHQDHYSGGPSGAAPTEITSRCFRTSLPSTCRAAAPGCQPIPSAARSRQLCTAVAVPSLAS